jgi:hypothetical protein
VFKNLSRNSPLQVLLILLAPARLFLLGATFRLKRFSIRPTEGQLGSSPSVQLLGGSVARPTQTGNFFFQRGLTSPHFFPLCSIFLLKGIVGGTDPPHALN